MNLGWFGPYGKVILDAVLCLMFYFSAASTATMDVAGEPEILSYAQ